MVPLINLIGIKTDGAVASDKRWRRNVESFPFFSPLHNTNDVT